MNTDDSTVDVLDPEDADARAEIAFERSGSYAFHDVPLTFSYEHEAATVRLGFSFGPGDVADFLYLLSLPGKNAARLRTEAQKDAFFQASAVWGAQHGLRIGTVTFQDAQMLVTQILEDWSASRADPIPDFKSEPTKN